MPYFECDGCGKSAQTYHNPHTYLYECPYCGHVYDAFRNSSLLRRVRKQRAIFLSQIVMAVKLYFLRRKALSIGRGVRVAPSFKCLSGNLIVGDNVRLNDAMIDATSRVEIGNNAFFGPGVRLLTAGHPVDRFDLERQRLIVSKPITIGRGVFIGTDAILLGGVTVGDHAVVGAGAVVTRDVPPFSVVAGNPAAVVKMISKGNNKTRP